MKNCSKGIKYLVLTAAMILSATVLISFLPVNGEERIYENMIRLHVIANSDSDEDQRVKLIVRDAVLEAVSAIPHADCMTEAETGIRSHTDKIARAAEKALREQGSDDGVSVLFDTETYPVRYYEGFSLPAGKYTSLRVVIGNGEGHNWWCVLFPPLCTASCEEEREEEFIQAGFTSDEYSLIKNDSGAKYKVRFKILEILADVFGFDY